MKKFHIVMVMIVVALALPLALYVQAADPTTEVKTSDAAMNVPVHKDVWNKAGSGFELSSVPTAAAVAPPQAEASEQHRIEALPNIDPADRKFFSPGYGAQTVISGEVEVLPTVDPADRKFFSPGYGAMSSVSKEAEVLPNIDPADRKFFTPGYGAMSGVSKEAEVLPNIDPADRKFFTPGYGAQTVMSREAEVLPTVVKDEVDPDEDIGLLEFFSPAMELRLLAPNGLR